MAHTIKREDKKISLGSMEFYVVPYDGETIPEDTELEKESNHIGHTKNGGTLNYSATWTVAESDDGKAKRRQLVKEEATINFSLITWNANTIKKLISTASVTEADGKRTLEVGGIENDNGIRYIIRGVHKDKVAGDVRITGVGVHTGGLEAVWQPENPSLISAQFELEPYNDSGRLYKYDEEAIEAVSGGES